ncbi:hypothetical protein TNCV_2469291 [Trichonephila clavipes]|nr:hypothetical protein TNCV_2469291 [Trichonephila clavipes]
MPKTFEASRKSALGEIPFRRCEALYSSTSSHLPEQSNLFCGRSKHIDNCRTLPISKDGNGLGRNLRKWQNIFGFCGRGR